MCQNINFYKKQYIEKTGPMKMAIVAKSCRKPLPA